MTYLVVVSDTHVNSSAGLWPPGFIKSQDGIEAPQNRMQRWLWPRWLEFCGQVKELGEYVLFVNGDPIQGIHKNKELQLMSYSKIDQCEAARQVFEPLAEKAREIYFVKGTMYHDGISGDDAEGLARALGAQVEDGQSARWLLRYRQDGKLFTFAHHTQTATVYHSTPPARRWREAKEDYADFGNEIPDVIVRSHVHWAGCYPDRMGRLFFTIPGWQLMYGFAYKLHPELSIRVGGLILWVQDGVVMWRMPMWNVPLPPIVEAKSHSPSTIYSRSSKNVPTQRKGSRPRK